MTIELVAGAIKAILMILLGLNLSLFLLYFERKGSALIQDRIGSNRASIIGFGKRLGLPNLGIINTLDRRPGETLHQGRFRSRRARTSSCTRWRRSSRCSR